MEEFEASSSSTERKAVDAVVSLCSYDVAALPDWVVYMDV